MKTKASILLTTLTLILLLSVVLAWPVLAVPPIPSPPALLDPTTIPKYVNQLDGPPPVFVPRVIRGEIAMVLSACMRYDVKSPKQPNCSCFLATLKENALLSLSLKLGRPLPRGASGWAAGDSARKTCVGTKQILRR